MDKVKPSTKKKRAVLTNEQALDKIKRIQPILEMNLRWALRIEAALEVGNDMVRELPDKAFPGAAA